MSENKKRTISLYNYVLNSELETDDSYAGVAGYFIGPKAENEDLYMGLLNKSIRQHMDLRKVYYSDEEGYIDQEIKSKQPYEETCKRLIKGHEELCKRLKDSVPFFSQRYQGHMLGDTVMAGTLGYIAAILYNQNNVATEASPITSELEKEVGKQLCQLMGFKVDSKEINGWGHITADGTIANIEAMWAARNLKAYPFAIRQMLEKDKTFAGKSFDEEVTINGGCKKFSECSEWELMNLSVDESLALTKRLADYYSLESDCLDTLIKPYLLATKGLTYYIKKYPELFGNIKIIVPATHHYSWPKAATLLGLGQDSIINIPVDASCKMDIEILENTLKECQKNKYPVLMVVGVIGSTSEGAIDDIEKILNLRKELSENEEGLQFLVHADAAWGGYLKTMLVKEETSYNLKKSHYIPDLPLSDYAQKQYANISLVDSVTVDPHKAGFIPYAAGALCYRNGNLRNLITFNAAYIHSDGETNMGIYGLEGSKPGAAAAAVWLAHRAIPLNQNGYGRILGECNYSSKLNYCYWITMKPQEDRQYNGKKYSYCVQPLVDLPEEILDLPKEILDSSEKSSNRDKIFQYIEQHIIGKDAEEIIKDMNNIKILRNVGTDVLMNTFVVNFTVDNAPNNNLEKLNELNNRLFERFSIIKGMKPEERPKYMLMMNTLSSVQYKKAFEHIKAAWNLKTPEEEYNINVLVNTVMQPFPNTPEFMQKTLKYLDSVIWEEIEKIEKLI